MKTKFLIIFLLYFGLNTFAQTNRNVFLYKVKKTIFLDSLKTDYIGKEFEFKAVRESKSDTEFCEKGLIERDTNIVYEFKKSNEKWYIKKSNGKENWKLFFNGDIKYKSSLQINGIYYKVEWSNASVWENEENYIFKLTPPPQYKNNTFAHLYFQL